MFKVTVWWGKEAVNDANNLGKTYEFETQAERDAFLLGAEEAEGWSEFSVETEP